MYRSFRHYGLSLLSVAALALLSMAWGAVVKSPGTTEPLPPSATQSANIKTSTLDLGKGVKLELVLVPAGKFMMGEKGSPEEMPVHEVTISKAFFMGRFEVMQEQYEALTGTNPSHFKGPQNPADSVPWAKAREFCKTLSDLSKKTVRLPTEAEWEYACRAGTTTTYYSGNDVASLKKVAWCQEKDAVADAPSHPVGQLQPNAFGLYDMHGNVYEWCQDWFDAGFYANSPKADPVNRKEANSTASKGPEPVQRGGSAGSPPGKARAAYRNHYSPIGKHTIGFRIVVEDDDKK